MRLFMSSLAASILILLAISPLVSAQEELRCLPEGKYQSISFSLTRGFEHTEGYLFYKSMQEKYGMSDKRSVIPNFRFLPPELDDVVISKTYAKLYGMEFIEFPKPIPIERDDIQSEIKRIQKENSYRTPMFGYDNNEQKYFVYGVWNDLGERLYVNRLEDYEDAKKQAIHNGNLVVTGNSFRGEPVFSFSTTIRRTSDGGSDFLCWFSEQGEMLIAPSLELLERMVEAATGEGPSLLEQPEYNLALSLLPQAGYSWSILFGVLERESNATLRKFQSKNQHDEGPRPLSNSPLFSVSITEMDERYVERGYKVYETAESAKRALEMANSSAEYFRRKKREREGEKSTMLSQIEEREMRTKRSVDGKMITTEFVYDREYMKKHMEWVNEMRRKMLKRIDDANKKSKDMNEGK